MCPKSTDLMETTSKKAKMCQKYAILGRNTFQRLGVHRGGGGMNSPKTREGVVHAPGHLEPHMLKPRGIIM